MNTIKFVLLTVVALFVGSLVNGAIVSISGAIIPPSWWQPTRSLRAVLIIGVAFLVGGIMMVQMIPSPWWFIGVDLGLAYLPMALGGRWLAGRIFGGSARN
jgi:hypothetical protein